MAIKDNKMISIIIPIYNAEKNLLRCLTSLEEKRELDEIILINDGSQDRSIDICTQFARKNKNVFIIDQRNQGVSIARNRGIYKSANSWIMFVDADDYLVVGWRELVDKSINNHEDSDIIVMAKDTIAEHLDKERCIKASLGEEESVKSVGESLNWVFSKLYSREFIVQSNIRFIENLTNGEDMLFNCALYSKAEKIVGEKNSIYCYVKNMNSSTNQFNSQFVETEYLFHNNLKQFLVDNKFENTDWQNLYEKGLLTGIYGLIYRISLVKERTGDSQLNELLNKKEYDTALGNLENHCQSINIITRMVLKQVKKGKPHTAVIIAKIFNNIKRFYYKINRNSIEERI